MPWGFESLPLHQNYHEHRRPQIPQKVLPPLEKKSTSALQKSPPSRIQNKTGFWPCNMHKARQPLRTFCPHSPPRHNRFKHPILSRTEPPTTAPSRLQSIPTRRKHLRTHIRQQTYKISLEHPLYRNSRNLHLRPPSPLILCTI